MNGLVLRTDFAKGNYEFIPHAYSTAIIVVTIIDLGRQLYGDRMNKRAMIFQLLWAKIVET